MQKGQKRAERRQQQDDRNKLEENKNAADDSKCFSNVACFVCVETRNACNNTRSHSLGGPGKLLNPYVRFGIEDGIAFDETAHQTERSDPVIM